MVKVAQGVLIAELVLDDEDLPLFPLLLLAAVLDDLDEFPSGRALMTWATPLIRCCIFSAFPCCSDSGRGW